ncbi:Origin recognition complex, subunit 1 [Actinomortierella ambigua]|nr:Origin recognition complex, subunit 1 [Actinomortierella ambigua]
MPSTQAKVERRVQRLAKNQSSHARDALQQVADSDSDDNEPAEWLGEPLNSDTLLKRSSSNDDGNHHKQKQQQQQQQGQPKRRATRGSGLSNIPYYAGFRKGDTEYHIGDCVLLRNDQYSHRFDHPFVAQILRLWRSEDGEMEGDFRWFHQAEDMERVRKHLRKGIVPDTFEAGELAYTLEDDVNQIETVVGKCTVMSEAEWRKRYGPQEATIESEDQGFVWFCRSVVEKIRGYVPLEWTTPKKMLEYKEVRPEKKQSPPKKPAPPQPSASTPTKTTIPSQSKAKSNASKTTKPRRRAVKSEIDESSSDDDASESDYESKEDEDEDEDVDEEDDDTPVVAQKKTAPKKTKAALAKAAPATPRKRKSTLPAPKVQARKRKTLEVRAPTTQRSVPTATPRSDFEHARNRLHVSAVPESLPCREDEFLEIQGYIESAIDEGTGSCIYISGVPGTGKTATVHEVIRSLQAKAEEGEISPFQFVEINGMKVTEPSYAYMLLWQALSEEKVTANHALQLLERQFSTPGPRRLPCVVLMDELDLLVTTKQTVMYNFFEWPNWQHSRLIVVAVANTMDLPERMLSNKVSSRLGLTRINFQPYTYPQLIQIVESRLEGIQAFRKEAIEFAARKVSAVSGDARRALDICRRAVEIVEQDALRRQAEQEGTNTLDSTTTTFDPEQVTIRTVDQAIKEMFASPNVRFIQTASLHQKLFLVALTAKLRRLGLAEVEFNEVAHAHIQTCKLQSIEPPTLSDLSAVCASLGASRCLLVESGKQDFYQRVRLNVSEEDVIMALKADPFFRRLIESLPAMSGS